MNPLAEDSHESSSLIFSAQVLFSLENNEKALFSSNDKTKKLKCHLLQFLFGTLSLNINSSVMIQQPGQRTC